MRNHALVLIFALAFATACALCQESAGGSSDASPEPAAQNGATHDNSIRQQVQEKLCGDKAFDNLQVRVAAGKLILTGTVPSAADRSRALELARTVQDVGSVEEHIDVRKDIEAAQRTKKAVSGQTAINETSNNTAGSISGNAGMTGTSPATGETSTPGGVPLSAAPQTSNSGPNTNATEAMGSAGMENDTLRREIESALQSDPRLTDSHIDVDVTDSEINLSGMAPSAREKELARRIAQSYGGNRRVIDSKMNLPSGRGSTGTGMNQGERPAPQQR